MGYNYLLDDGPVVEDGDFVLDANHTQHPGYRVSQQVSPLVDSDGSLELLFSSSDHLLLLLDTLQHFLVLVLQLLVGALLHPGMRFPEGVQSFSVYILLVL